MPRIPDLQWIASCAHLSRLQWLFPPLVTSLYAPPPPTLYIMLTSWCVMSDRPHTNVFSFSFSLLATTSADQTIKIWQTSDFTLKSTLKEPQQRWVWDCAFSEDSQYVVAGKTSTAFVDINVKLLFHTKHLHVSLSKCRIVSQVLPK